jgi:pyruvate dehydrogenase E2 component (dihydrolipoamide acetyltransferase)
MTAATATIIDLQMPRLSDSMEEGRIIRWLKGVGELITLGEHLVEIETDKATVDYEADMSGTLVEIVAAEGEELPVGALIARIALDGDAPAPLASVAAAPKASERVKSSPVARRLAADLGIELAQIKGSGPDGRITRSDVEAAAAVASPSPAKHTSEIAAPAPGPADRDATLAAAHTTKQHGQRLEPTTLQRTVARRMAESKATTPHFYLEAEIDMGAALQARDELKRTAGAQRAAPSLNDMIVKACALALAEHPRVNGSYRDGAFELHERVNVGIAVAAQDALIVPVITDADTKGLAQIAAESRALAARVRDGSITPPELSGGTFTVSNLGMFGISNFAAIINPGQAAILAVGAVRDTPVVRDHELAIGHRMTVTLACDHRILYGADGAQFLAQVRALLEQPVSLAL